MSEMILPDSLAQLRDRTPARVFAGRAGAGYLTSSALKLKADHAAARDAVHDEVDWSAVFGADFPMLQTLAQSKGEYLMRPDRGRCFDDTSRTLLGQFPIGAEMQLVVGDGLSATAVKIQTPRLLESLAKRCLSRGWSLGMTFGVRHCRVGILNDIGEILKPNVVVLLIGERPGLATAESLSAYLAWQPRSGHTDAQRNLISNIHARGVTIEDAAIRIADLADKMMQMQSSGVHVKETGGSPILSD